MSVFSLSSLFFSLFPQYSGSAVSNLGLTYLYLYKIKLHGVACVEIQTEDELNTK